MKKILFTASAAVLTLCVTSCTDYFLDLNPTDQQTEASYFRNAAEFEAAANATYSFYGFKDMSETVNGTKYTRTFYDIMDNNSDILSGVHEIAAGTLAAATNDTHWSLCYAKIRKCNVVIGKGEEYAGTEDISASIAVARFFRAYQYFDLLQRFGGVPIVTKSLSSTSEELYAPRNSRYEVVKLILDDLDYAVRNLPDEKDYDGKVSTQGTQAFKARVLLFEATWEKYVGTTTDGDNETFGAGSNKPAEYPSVESMLTEAASLADAVITSGKYQLWNAEGTPYERIAYNYLFNLEDENTNPMGFKKSQNHEYILQVAYDHDNNRLAKNVTKVFGGDNNASSAVTIKMMNMFPCVTDGLPYLYSKDYNGYNRLTDAFENRDSRLTACVKRPGDIYYVYGTAGADKETYAKADYVTVFDFPMTCAPYYPLLLNAGYTGFQNRKFATERKDYRDEDEGFNYPVLRLAELYLIYAEAKCELGNGKISDDDLNKSINILHDRSGSAHISNTSVAQANANYLANTGKTGSMTILELIRNERAVELRNEMQRPYDLLRWGVAEEVLNSNRSGIVVKNPDGTDTELVNFSYETGGNVQKLYSSAAAVYGFETLEDGSQALIVNDKSQFNMQRKNYLYPIPLSQIQLNPALLQNPGY